MQLVNLSHALFKRSRANSPAFFASYLFMAALAAAQTATPDAAEKKEDVFVLSAFQVSAQADVGYRAGNSVSATRIDTAIKNLPFSISAFTQQFISDIGARDLFDIAQYAPGVTHAAVEFASGNSTYAIRGFNQNPQRNGFVGEAYIDAATIERVEVVKGPASVLYGEVAPGGTVNYITKRAGPKPFASLSLRAGEFNYGRAALDINRPLVGDRLMFRLNTAWENDIEYFEPGQASTVVISPTLTWRITDKVAVTVDYQNLDKKENPPFATRLPTTRIVAPLPASGILSTASVLQQNSGEDRGFGNFYPLADSFTISANTDRRDSEMESLNAEITAQLSDAWTARANFNRSEYQIWFKGTGLGQINITVPNRYFAGAYPTSNTAEYRTGAAAYAADLLKNPRLALDAPQAQMQRRLNLQETFGTGRAAQVEIAGKFMLGHAELKPLFGVSYQEYRDNTRMRQVAASLFPAPWNMYVPSTWNRDTDYDADSMPLTQFDRGNRRSKAAYAILNADLFKGKLFGVAGARFTRSSGSNDNFLTPASSIGKAEHEKVTPQFGLGWKPHRDMLLYASYSSSFQNAIANLQVANVPSGPAAPSTSEGYEAGIKTDFLGGRISSTISVFTIDQQDRVINFNTTSPAGLIQVNRMQGTLDRSKGVEAELTWSPTDNFQVYVSASHNNVRVIKTPAGTEYLLGSQPENTVENLVNLWARYSFKDGLLKGLWLGAGFNYSGKKAQRVNNPALFTDPFTLVNSAMGYEWKWQNRPTSLTINWNNMTDESYVPAAFLRGRPSAVTVELRVKY
ncbi:MAG TPA: TonB-dependent receptor [Lacunisphaera sp.]